MSKRLTADYAPSGLGAIQRAICNIRLEIRCLGLVSLLILPIVPSFAQDRKLHEMFVIVDFDFLREDPNVNSTAKVTVRRGDKVRVMPSYAPGWYIGTKVEGVVASLAFGYIRGSSIAAVYRVPKSKTETTNGTKNRNIRPPKYVILDASPDKTDGEVSSPKHPTPTNSTNYCSPPLFCPDIEEVQTALIVNQEKFSKGKFEKTVDWQMRMSTVLSEAKLGGGRTAADKMTFLYEVGTGSLTAEEADYDADSEKWTFPVDFRAVGDRTCLPLSSEKTGELFCLIIRPDLGSLLNIFVSMPTSTAATNDKKVRIAFVGKIIAPYVWSHENSNIKDILAGIHFELEEIICLNPKTGQRWKVEYSTSHKLAQ